MDFIGITITDLSENVKERAYASIKSFLKYHNNKLIVYIIGNNEFLLNDKRIEIIRIPKKDYNLSKNVIQPYFQNIMNILVEKTLIFSKHTNFMFFENDVFFFDSMQSVWDNLSDGISGHPNTYGKHERIKYRGINTGLVFVKNYKLNYSIDDIIKYFSNNISHWPDEEFLTNIADEKDIHFLDQDVNIVTDISFPYNKPFYNTKSIHTTGNQKPPFKNIKKINKLWVPLFRKVNELLY